MSSEPTRASVLVPEDTGKALSPVSELRPSGEWHLDRLPSPEVQATL